jgi:PucR-like helix-turn-helix protein/diguanylate cyclase with GGDEF domain
MTASELQRVVDNLGDRLGRSVAIDDHRIRILAYNAHTGEVDKVRLHAIMRREIPQEVLDNFEATGGFDNTDLFTRPARPDLGLTIERYVMPIRYDGTLLGFIWLMASDGPISEDDRQAIRQAAERAAQILHRDFLIDELRQGKVREYMRDLLSEDPRLHVHAARQLIEDELLRPGAVTSMVVTIPVEADQPFPEKDRHALAIGLDRACRRASPASAIHLVRADHGVVVVAHSGASEREIDHFTLTIKKHVCEVTHCRPDDCYVGIGASRPALDGVHDSYLEARHAADIARVIRALGTVVRYSGLGVHGLLAEVPIDRLRRTIHPGLRRLLANDPAHARLVATLEAYFKHSGDIRRTAEHLGIHRATVHYRLRRVEDIAQVDLSDGDDWLALHLGLKVAQLVKAR